MMTPQHDRQAARRALVRLLAEQIVQQAYDRPRTKETDSHASRPVREVQHRQAARDLDR